MPPTPLVFIDCETTGLRPHDQMWELALIRREVDQNETVHQWFIHHDSTDVDPTLPAAMREDRDERFTRDAAVTPEWLGPVVQHLLRPGANGQRPHLVGACPWFDAQHLLGELIPEPLWHHHLIDVEALAVGAYPGRLVPPWTTSEILTVCGLPESTYPRHTALGDAMMARDIYDHVMGNKPILRAGTSR